MEVVRTRLAVTKPGTYHGLIHCARQVLRTEGIMSFYRGLAPTMVFFFFFIFNFFLLKNEYIFLNIRKIKLKHIR